MEISAQQTASGLWFLNVAVCSCVARNAPESTSLPHGCRRHGDDRSHKRNSLVIGFMTKLSCRVSIVHNFAIHISLLESRIPNQLRNVNKFVTRARLPRASSIRGDRPGKTNFRITSKCHDVSLTSATDWYYIYNTVSAIRIHFALCETFCSFAALPHSFLPIMLSIDGPVVQQDSCQAPIFENSEHYR